MLAISLAHAGSGTQCRKLSFRAVYSRCISVSAFFRMPVRISLSFLPQKELE